MNYVNRFTHLLQNRNTAEFTSEDIEMLREIVVRYPYFQAARFLLVQAIKTNGLMGFESELNLLAVNTIHRSVLYQAFAKQEIAPPSKKLKSEEIPFSFGMMEGSAEPGEHSELIEEIDRRLVTGMEQYYNIEKEFPVEPPAPTKKISEGKTRSSDDLIEAFLQKQKEAKTSITRPSIAEENFKPDQSLQTSMDMVSETLAKIYIKQGKIEEALQMYERLMLLKPEKSVYFARQIDELKKKIK